MRKTITFLLAASMLVGAAAFAEAAKAPKPVTLFEDDEGDAGINAAGPAPAVGETGVDLVSGQVTQKGKDLEFVITHASMPPTGSFPEAARLIWGLTVGNTQYEMTIKSLDVGKPDVIASVMGQDPNGEERVGTIYQGVARFEECGTISLGINWSQCTTLGYYDAAFDTAAGTVTYTVPLDVMNAKKGTVIMGGSGGRATTGCQICWVLQYAERSLTPHTILDAAIQTGTLKVK